MPHAQHAPTIWLDLDDVFEHAEHHPRPTGIQRVGIEFAKALHRSRPPGSVRFLRHHHATASFYEVPWPAVEALHASTSAEAQRPAEVRGATGARYTPPALTARQRLNRAIVGALPRTLYPPLREANAGLAAMLRGLAAFLRALPRARLAPRTRPPAANFEAAVAPGDWLVALTAPWAVPDYAARAARLRDRHGIRLAVWVHDLIAMRHPEWCDRRTAAIYRDWLNSVLPVASLVCAASRSVLADLREHVAAERIAVAAPMRQVPIAAGIGPGDAPAGGCPTGHLPPPGSYVLFVSTIEPRKNHALLLRVWQRLLREMPPGRVPTLVFAGTVGWLSADLMQQIENADHLGGKLLHVRAPSDAELAALYRGCLFTVYPSFYEGWGIPVVESLAFGKPCIAAEVSSLPEAGAGLVRFIDPDNATGAAAVIRATLDDAAGLAAWEQEVRARFRPRSWAECGAALAAALEHPA